MCSSRKNGKQPVNISYRVFFLSISKSYLIPILEYSLSPWTQPQLVLHCLKLDCSLIVRPPLWHILWGIGLSYIFNARVGVQKVVNTFHLIDWFIKLIQWLRSNTYFSGVFMYLNLILTILRKKYFFFLYSHSNVSCIPFYHCGEHPVFWLL